MENQLRREVFSQSVINKESTVLKYFMYALYIERGQLMLLGNKKFCVRNEVQIHV
jgi:hypothetical protein